MSDLEQFYREQSAQAFAAIEGGVTSLQTLANVLCSNRDETGAFDPVDGDYVSRRELVGIVRRAVGVAVKEIRSGAVTDKVAGNLVIRREMRRV